MAGQHQRASNSYAALTAALISHAVPSVKPSASSPHQQRNHVFPSRISSPRSTPPLIQQALLAPAAEACPAIAPATQSVPATGTSQLSQCPQLAPASSISARNWLQPARSVPATGTGQLSQCPQLTPASSISARNWLQPAHSVPATGTSQLSQCTQLATADPALKCAVALT